MVQWGSGVMGCLEQTVRGELASHVYTARGDTIMRRNRSRGYQELRVWQDAIQYYVLTCTAFRGLPYELKRVAAQAIGSSDSVHRNIAEGYCRRSLREYLNFLNIALGSLGESVSGLRAYLDPKQIDPTTFEQLDSLAYRLENGLLRLVESLEHKRDSAGRANQSTVKESNALYEAQDGFSSPITPLPQDPITPQEE